MPMYTTRKNQGGGTVDPTLSTRLTNLEDWKSTTVDPTLTTHADTLGTVQSDLSTVQGDVSTISGQVSTLQTNETVDDAYDVDQQKMIMINGGTN